MIKNSSFFSHYDIMYKGDTMRVGVFDSGIGGLTVLKELIKKYPNNQYFYFGDNINVPYGTKTKEELLFLSSNIIDFLITKEVDMVIIACGTVSSNIYAELVLKYDIPIHNVIDATIDYVNNSNLETVGLIATDMTVRSKVFEKRLNKRVISKACPLFVSLIEEDSKDLKNIISEYLSDIKDIDALIYGCTHYPIIENQISNYLNNKVINLNMGTILASNIPIISNGKLKIRLYFSKVNKTVIKNIENILECDYSLEELELHA